MKTTMKDPYQVLGIEKNATDEQIKEAYRKLMKEHHPDIHMDDKKKKEAEGKAKDINVAYDTLSDKNKRAAYDNPGPQFHGQGMDMNDIISRMFGGQGAGFFQFGGFGGPANGNVNFHQTYQQGFDVNVFTLILGGEVKVKFSNGEEKAFVIPANTPINAKFQVKLDKNIDIILVPNVIIPKLSEDQLKKLREALVSTKVA